MRTGTTADNDGLPESVARTSRSTIRDESAGKSTAVKLTEISPDDEPISNPETLWTSV